MQDNSIKLIEGTFEPDDSAKVLFPLINSKINYHSLELFSADIRSGGTIESSQKRIEYLKNSVDELHQLIKKAAQDNCKLQISADIKITVVPKDN